MASSGLRNLADVMSGNATRRRTDDAVNNAVNPAKKKKKKVTHEAMKSSARIDAARARGETNRRVDSELERMFDNEKINSMGLRRR